MKKPYAQRRLRFGPLVVQKRNPPPKGFPEAMRHAHVRYAVGWLRRGGNHELPTWGFPLGVAPSLIRERIRLRFRCCDRLGKRPKPRPGMSKRDLADWKWMRGIVAQTTDGNWSASDWCRSCWRDTLTWCPELSFTSPHFAGRSGSGRRSVATGQGETGETKMVLDTPEQSDLPAFAKVDNILALAGGKKGKMLKAAIVTAPRAGKYGYDVDLKIGKVTVTATLKPNSMNYRALFSAFGSKEAAWVGKGVRIGVKTLDKGQFAGTDMVAIEPEGVKA